MISAFLISLSKLYIQHTFGYLLNDVSISLITSLHCYIYYTLAYFATLNISTKYNYISIYSRPQNPSFTTPHHKTFTRLLSCRSSPSIFILLCACFVWLFFPSVYFLLPSSVFLLPAV